MYKITTRTTATWLALGLIGTAALAAGGVKRYVADNNWEISGPSDEACGFTIESDFLLRLTGEKGVLTPVEGLAIGAPLADSVYILDKKAHLTPTGSGEPQMTLDHDDGWTFVGASGGEAGWALEGGTFAGLGSLAIGAPSDSAGKGLVYVLDFFAGDVADDYVVATITGNKDDYLGWALASGDLNNDGQDDLVVGAPGVNSFQGAAHVFYGPLSGDLDVDDADITITGEHTTGVFGIALAVAKLDGGWTDDLIVGAYQSGPNAEGYVHIFFNPQPGDDLASDIADQTILSGVVDIENLGYSLDAGTDLNGDGLEDLLIGAPMYWCNYQLDTSLATYTNSKCTSSPTHKGTAYIVSGSNAKWTKSGTVALPITNVATGSLVGTADFGAVGINVAMIGDVDDDGVQDFFAGSRGLDAAFVAPGTIGDIDVDDALVTTYVSDDPNEHFGHNSAYVGDLDQDGVDDVLISAPGMKWTYDSADADAMIYIWLGE